MSGTIEDFAAVASDPRGTREVLGFSNDGALHQDRITLRTAFVTSLHPPTVKLLQQIGAEYARRLGYTSPLADNLTLAHGGTGVSLEEQLNAFAVYPNGGNYIPSIYVKKIVDRHGNVLEEHHPPVLSDDANQGNRPEVSAGSQKRNLPSVPGRSKVADSGTSVRRGIENAVVFTITSMLRGVVQEGTGTVLKQIVGRPDIAGKTGTSEDCMDAWFVGFSPDYTCGVWVGFDEMKSIGHGETGGSAAAPLWGYFMREVLKGIPVKEFPPPKSIE